MSGARLIVNARYFHIARPGETASKYALVPEAAAGLVDYIATRESVVLNFSWEYELKPATQKQKDTIEQFLKASPDIEKSREYKAFAENKTAANASRLITRATEYVFGLDDDGESNPSRPATRAQRERIQEFVQKVPAIRDTPEYADYLANRTRENASEVLSHALEVALESAADPETLRIMLNYIAERPGVVRDAERQHGLFCSAGVADLEAEKDAIAVQKGNIYSMVFSLRRTDADMLCYDRQDMWRGLFNMKQAELAKELHVSLNELHWVAAVHNTRHHPHAHFIAYSTNPRTRMYLSKDAIEKIKSTFVSEIFRDERYNIFAPREEIRQQLSDRLEQLLTRLDQHSADELSDLQLPQRLSELKEAILASRGRHVYKFLPQNVKAMVDRLLDELSDVPEIRALLTEYGKYQQQLELYYKNHPDEPEPLSAVTRRSSLYPLKNLVVQCALQAESMDFGPESPPKTGTSSGFFDLPDEITPSLQAEPEFIKEDHTWPPERRRRAKRIDSVQDHSHTGGGNMNWNKPKEPTLHSQPAEMYRYAQYLRYEEDKPEEAITWYNLAEQRGHAEAAYQLAQHYLRHPVERDIRLGNEYLLTAKLRFESQLQESANEFLVQDIQNGRSYNEAVQENGLYKERREDQKTMSRAAYFLGRIHLCGIEIESMEGIEPKDIPRLQVPADPRKAEAYFRLAFDGGYTHAAYYLGKLYFRGDLNPNHEPDYRQAAAWFMRNEDNSYCRFALADMYERGQGFEADAAKSAELYRSCMDANPYLASESAYAVAQMQFYGILPETDMLALYKKAAEIWLRQDAPEAQIHMRLSRMYEHALGFEKDLSKALAHCLEAEKADPSPRLSYRIAQLMEKNGASADAVYSKYREALSGMLDEASRPEAPPDEQRIYRIASMYHYGRGTEPDAGEALEWYLKDKNNEHCRFGAATLLRYGEGVAADPARAAALYRSCLEGSGYIATESAYALAQMQREGSVPETDMQALYRKAADVWLRQESAAARVHIRLSHMYEHGLGVEKSLYEALSHSMRAEEIESSPRLSYHIAQLMEKHGMSESVIRDRYREALEGMLREAADPNAPPDRQRNYRIASMYHYGRGTEPDAGKALEWYLKDMGNAHCRFGAATLLRYGEGIPTDPGRAAALYRSCLEGNGYIATESAYALAQMQRMNLLPETDMQALYRKAADVWMQQEAPEERVRLRLARMFEHGLGVPQNSFEALRLYETLSPTPELSYKLGRLHQQTGSAPDVFQRHFQNALQGMLQQERDATAPPDAQRAEHIASMYRYGLGTPVNRDEAIRWYAAAAERGSTYAEDQLQKLAEQKKQEQESRNMNVASRLLMMIGNALRQQILRDQQPGARPDRKQRRQQRKLKHALGQREDHEQIYQ